MKGTKDFAVGDIVKVIATQKELDSIFAHAVRSGGQYKILNVVYCEELGCIVSVGLNNGRYVSPRMIVQAQLDMFESPTERKE